MTPRDRIKRHAQLIALGTVLIWALLCYLILLSPRFGTLNDLTRSVADSSKQLADMRKEIEDARIIGGPAPGTARFEKFGILTTGEEQLFLSDLIAFCKDTTNTLNLVRRSEYSQPATVPTAEQGGSASSSGAAAPADPNQPPQPTILRVPHTVSFSGTFLSTFYLLRQLESYKRLLTVERMDLSTDSQDGYPRLNGNITIELYLVKQPPGAPAPAPAQPASTTTPAPSSPSSAEVEAEVEADAEAEADAE